MTAYHFNHAALIVKDRRVQKNFQLIVITHESEFVDMLGRSQFVDDFYEVTKNRE